MGFVNLEYIRLFKDFGLEPSLYDYMLQVNVIDTYDLNVNFKSKMFASVSINSSSDQKIITGKQLPSC